ncbi:MAG: hypothetical protein L3J39_12710 [Verrucomicrobiales bacterium]|nr:hypothetical protein [Verrucomicrobiales bacterium]
MTATQKIFKYQIWHLFSLAFLILALKLYLSNKPTLLDGMLWGINTSSWFWLALAAPIIHQVYVWLVWRFELHLRVFSNKLGTQQAFNLYALGFSFLFLSRLVTITLLAISSKNTLHLNPVIAYVLAALITPLVIYLFYSVKKYFTIERAYGIDHFDKNYNQPFVKKGIFKYTNNGMYVFGLLVLYLPGLLFLSEVALLVALFNHVYIWVHYYFTERPDMLVIYGNAP